MNNPSGIGLCSKAIYFALIFIPFFASFSSAATNIFIGIAIFAFLVKKGITGNFSSLKKVPLAIPFLLILLISMISFANTVSLKASVQGIGKLLRYLAIVLVVTEELKDSKHMRRIVTAALLGLLLASLDGLFQLTFGVDFIRQRPVLVTLDLPRVTAAFAHPNMFGTYMVLFLPLGICMALYGGKGVQRRFSYVTSVLTLLCLLSTFSRASFSAFLAALLFIGTLKRDKMIFIALILIMVIVPLALPQAIRDWKKTTGSVWEFLLETKKIGDFRNALNMISHHPWAGVGMNTYSLNLQKYKVRDSSRFESDTGYSHNSYLQMAAEIGLFGLVAFLWLLFRLFRSGVRYYRRLEDGFLKVATLGVMAGLVAFLVNGFMETNLYYSKVASLFWFCAGLLLAMSRFVKESSDAQRV